MGNSSPGCLCNSSAPTSEPVESSSALAGLGSRGTRLGSDAQDPCDYTSHSSLGAFCRDKRITLPHRSGDFLEDRSLDELLHFFEFSAGAVAMLSCSSADPALAKRTTEAVRRVRKRLVDVERVARRSFHENGGEADLWLNMHMGIRRRFRTLGDIVRKVQVENRIVKHWQHQTNVSKANMRTSSQLSCATASRIDLDSWDNVDVFQLDQEMQRPLTHVFMTIWQTKNLAHLCKTRTSRASGFVELVEAQYRQNPYHNRMHAADVTLVAYYFWSKVNDQESMAGYLNEVDLLVLIFAAACHDLAHPGLSNDFLVKTRHALALRYNDKSPLENFHVATAFELMKEQGISLLEHNHPSPPVGALRGRVIEMVLATDMTQHKQVVGNFAAEFSEHDKAQDIDKLTFEKLLLHVADIGHPLRPERVHREWSRRITDEFFAIGDKEKELGLQPMALFDRAKAPSLAKGQVGFLNFVVKPAWSTLCLALGSAGDAPDDCLKANLASWEAEAKREDEGKAIEADAVAQKSKV